MNKVDPDDEEYRVTAKDEAAWVAALDKYEADEKARSLQKSAATPKSVPEDKAKIDADYAIAARMFPAWLPPPGTPVAYLGEIYPALARALKKNADKVKRPEVKPSPRRMVNTTIRFKKNKNREMMGYGENRVTAEEEASWVAALEKYEADQKSKEQAEAGAQVGADENVGAGAQNEAERITIREDDSWPVAFAKMKAILDRKEKENDESDFSRLAGVEKTRRRSVKPVSKLNLDTADFKKYGYSSRYEMRAKMEAAQRVRSLSAKEVEEIRSYQAMAADLKRDADLTGMIMDRLWEQIKKEEAERKLWVIEIKKKVREQAAASELNALTENRKAAEKKAHNQLFREATGAPKRDILDDYY